MASRLKLARRGVRTPPTRVAFNLESLEGRLLMAAPVPALQPPVPLLDPRTIPQFMSDITPDDLGLYNGFFDDFKYTLVNNHVTVGAYPISQDLGLGLVDAAGSPVKTPLFGYGTSQATASYPGRSFEVQQGSPIAVTWVNGLPTQHVVNIDPTLLDTTAGTGLTYGPGSNALSPSVPIVTHLHGGHTDAIYDGTPLQWFTGGAAPATGKDYTNTQVYNPTQPANTFTYRNDQQAGTLWYHDHAMGVTRLNAYAGMAGFYIVRNAYDTGQPNNPLGLPADDFEVGLAIQDKQFLSDGRLWYGANAQTFGGATVASTLPEQFGDTILVNGKVWPKMKVEARRYRFHLLNGSDSRFYTMTVANAATLATTPIWQIGTDDGLLNTPVKLTALTLGPGERADVIVDFTKYNPGTRFLLTNSAPTPFPAGARVVAGLTDRIMAFDVVAPTSPDTTVAPTKTGPTTTPKLNYTDPLPDLADPVTNTRAVALYETTDALGRITPLLGTPGSSAEFMDPVTETIAPGATEVWTMYNNTADTHPIHLHQTSFQVLTRATFSTKLVNRGVSGTGVTNWGMGPVTRVAALPVAPNEVAWKDTIQINPGEVITLRAKFDLGGQYVWHCHILSHEEHDMMRFFQVGADRAPAPGVVVDATGAVVGSLGILAAAPAPAALAGPVTTAVATILSPDGIGLTKESDTTVSIVDQVLV